mmetsp:Transcript_35969/g.101252  ORF Transcript_35969/g.101252 Transcript_35969/m.101252 type:complete len:258 (-) Transcript_35969:177-950(-)
MLVSSPADGALLSANSRSSSALCPPPSASRCKASLTAAILSRFSTVTGSWRSTGRPSGDESCWTPDTLWMVMVNAGGGTEGSSSPAASSSLANTSLQARWVASSLSISNSMPLTSAHRASSLGTAPRRSATRASSRKKTARVPAGAALSNPSSAVCSAARASEPVPKCVASWRTTPSSSPCISPRPSSEALVSTSGKPCSPIARASRASRGSSTARPRSRTLLLTAPAPHAGVFSCRTCSSAQNAGRAWLWHSMCSA